jgi:FeS assembly protein IscX
MGRGLTWTNVDELGEWLYDAYPDENPLDLELPELRQLVEALDGFEAGAGAPPGEALLESIRMAWYATYSAGSC